MAEERTVLCWCQMNGLTIFPPNLLAMDLTMSTTKFFHFICCSFIWVYPWEKTLFSPHVLDFYLLSRIFI